MKLIPKGMFVPVITPFTEQDEIDFDSLRIMIDYVIDNGVDSILIGGSTGEYHTMSLEERKTVIEKGCAFVAGRVPVLAGVGTPTAKGTIELANFAADCGAAWGLVLPPYYAPTTMEGNKEFYKEIATNSRVGIVMYNNPSATNVLLPPEFIAELAAEENIVGLKDTDDLAHTCEVISLTKDIADFGILQGFDSLVLPALSVGAAGGFAVLMNALPKEYAEMYRLTKESRWEEARELNLKMMKLQFCMECEPYPGPVKAMLRAMGYPAGELRKPIVECSEVLRKEMFDELKKFGYDVK